MSFFGADAHTYIEKHYSRRTARILSLLGVLAFIASCALVIGQGLIVPARAFYARLSAGVTWSRLPWTEFGGM